MVSRVEGSWKRLVDVNWVRSGRGPVRPTRPPCVHPTRPPSHPTTLPPPYPSTPTYYLASECCCHFSRLDVMWLCSSGNADWAHAVHFVLCRLFVFACGIGGPGRQAAGSATGEGVPCATRLLRRGALQIIAAATCPWSFLQPCISFFTSRGSSGNATSSQSPRTVNHRPTFPHAASSDIAHVVLGRAGYVLIVPAVAEPEPRASPASASVRAETPPEHQSPSTSLVQGLGIFTGKLPEALQPLAELLDSKEASWAHGKLGFFVAFRVLFPSHGMTQTRARLVATYAMPSTYIEQ